MARLLAINNEVYQQQLIDAVSVFQIFCMSIHHHFKCPYLSSLKCAPYSELFLVVFYLIQGFKDSSLTVTEAVAILNNFEQRTGKIITHDQLHDGFLKDLLIDEDYNLKGKVNTHFYLDFPSDSFKTCFITICNLVSKWRRFVVLRIHCTHRCSHFPRVSYYAPLS